MDYGSESQYEAPKLVGWVMSISGGAIKDEQQARIVIIIFVALVILASLYIGTHQSTTKVDAHNIYKPANDGQEPKAHR